MAMRPPSGISSPASIRSTVVLPLPEGPSRARKAPSGTVKVTPSAAAVAPKRFVRSVTSTDISASSGAHQPRRGGDQRRRYDNHQKGQHGHGRTGPLLEVVVLGGDLHRKGRLAG